MTNAKKKNDAPTIIKKYANRRLYDTGRSSYVTLDDLCIMVKEGHDFVVVDAKSGEDLTHEGGHAELGGEDSGSGGDDHEDEDLV